MLRTRFITAVVLLIVLLSVLFLGSPLIINLLCTLFFAAASWESSRLFGYRYTKSVAAFWSVIFLSLVVWGNSTVFIVIWILGCVSWAVIFIPSLHRGLHQRTGFSNQSCSILYQLSILACFLAIVSLQQHSSFYLLSVMAIVWVADIGAYFVGRAFGSHKMAPFISPGKSWEGAMGGWSLVLILSVISTQIPSYLSSDLSSYFSFLSDSFSFNLLQRWGWLGMGLILTLLTAASVVGDLVESQLKRHAHMKDSSQLLPGHGGVLDRIDALVLVLPLAILIDMITNHL